MKETKKWGIALTASREVSKAIKPTQSRQQLLLVNLCKPDPLREELITPNGGHMGEVSGVERMSVYKPACRELGHLESNGLCRPHTNTN